jgi:hypothetical protein
MSDTFDLLFRLVRSIEEGYEGYHVDEDALNEARVLIGLPGPHNHPHVEEPRRAEEQRWYAAQGLSRYIGVTMPRLPNEDELREAEHRMLGHVLVQRWVEPRYARSGER